MMKSPRRWWLVWLVLLGPRTLLGQDPKPVLDASKVEAVKVESAKPEVAATLTLDQKAKNLESFDVVWKTIRDTHFDPKLGGLDWDAVRDEIRPEVEKASTMTEVRASITKMLERLGQSHFGIIPVEAYRSLDETKQGTGEPGLDVRILGNRAVVVSVLDDSAASKAGVKPGWVIEKVTGKTTAELFQAVEKAYEKSGMIAARKTRAILARLSGPIGGTVAVDFLDGQDRPIHLDLKLDEPQGVVSPPFGNLPTFHVRFTSKRVDRTIGYVALNIFFDAVRVLDLYARAIEEHHDAEGLILDLRGNPGGIGGMSIAMGGWLVTGEDRKLGTMITRNGSIRFSLNPRVGAYEGPVAVLVDELSMSTSEILAGGLKDLKRARIFGSKTPGAALPSMFVVLPNGDRFQYAFANYISDGGQPLEGLGVTPDVDAPPDRAALLEGRDPALDAATRWIREAKAKP